MTNFSRFNLFHPKGDLQPTLQENYIPKVSTKKSPSSATNTLQKLYSTSNVYKKKINQAEQKADFGDTHMRANKIIKPKALDNNKKIFSNQYKVHAILEVKCSGSRWDKSLNRFTTCPNTLITTCQITRTLPFSNIMI